MNQFPEDPDWWWTPPLHPFKALKWYESFRVHGLAYRAWWRARTESPIVHPDARWSIPYINVLLGEYHGNREHDLSLWPLDGEGDADLWHILSFDRNQPPEWSPNQLAPNYKAQLLLTSWIWEATWRIHLRQQVDLLTVFGHRGRAREL